MICLIICQQIMLTINFPKSWKAMKQIIYFFYYLVTLAFFFKGINGTKGDGVVTLPASNNV